MPFWKVKITMFNPRHFNIYVKVNKLKINEYLIIMIHSNNPNTI